MTGYLENPYRSLTIYACKSGTTLMLALDIVLTVVGSILSGMQDLSAYH